MATVFAISTTNSDDEHDRLELEYMLDSVERDRFGVHAVVDSPENADLILFVEREKAAGAQLDKVREHPLVQEYYMLRRQSAVQGYSLLTRRLRLDPEEMICPQPPSLGALSDTLL